MACNLLPTSLSHRSCHKDEIKGWIFIKMSVHGSSKFSGCAFDKASFAARSASSFPLIFLWLGSQQNVINLPLDNIFWHACKTLFTRGFLLSCFRADWFGIQEQHSPLNRQIREDSPWVDERTQSAWMLSLSWGICNHRGQCWYATESTGGSGQFSIWDDLLAADQGSWLQVPWDST